MKHQPRPTHLEREEHQNQLRLLVPVGLLGHLDGTLQDLREAEGEVMPCVCVGEGPTLSLPFDLLPAGIPPWC